MLYLFFQVGFMQQFVMEKIMDKTIVYLIFSYKKKIIHKHTIFNLKGFSSKKTWWTTHLSSKS